MIRRRLMFLLVLLIAPAAGIAPGQEPIDKADASRGGAMDLSNVTVRVRVTGAASEVKSVGILWRHGGEGLGGSVTRGAFTGEDGQPMIGIGQWSKPLPLAEVAGAQGAWRFPTIVIAASTGKKATPLRDVAVDFEFVEGGRVIRSFTEEAPAGATVGFAVPAGAKDRQAFLDALAGLSEHARQRHDRLAKQFPEPAKMPELFGVIGHLAGYGEGSGYGIRHSNREIVKEECQTLRLLGVNGLVSGRSVQLADAAGAGSEFRRVYWGGPGSGSPMGMLKKRGGEAEACPYDPELAGQIAARAAASIAEYKAVGAKESWALWWDEIGVAAKGHLQTCPRCRERFIEYLKAQHVDVVALGAKDWEDVKPYPIWPEANAGDKANRLAPAPGNAADGLRYYYTFRFMTEATAQLFVEPAKQFRDANIFLYAMQGPTPSWSGHSLDWHEFYDRGANTALVFETSNRDPRACQWESYLADIARGICARHHMPMGVLVKPHRGAVEQRMLAVVARGAKVIEWYTYGPDYAKGDSFSQSPELLERVAKAARFLGENEQYLYDARPAVAAKVAFCSPRSSEIWGKATDLGVTAFEDAKWVYLALRHAHVPVDVLSEQQLAEGRLDQYKLIYVIGPNLRRDAADQLKTWVQAGGTLWTDAMGLSRDEANQPAYEDLTGLRDRRLQTWGSVEPYKATDFKPFAEDKVPEGAAIVWAEGGKGPVVVVGRELVDARASREQVLSFADGRSAVFGRNVGKGKIVVVNFWAGLTYSARVRHATFDMSEDFDAFVRAQIASPSALGGRVPVKPALPLVEAIPLTKNGRTAIALMNWAYRRGAAGQETLVPAQKVKIDMRDLGEIKTIRSAKHGSLPVTAHEPGVYSVILPRLDEIDLLILN
jgi:hypothetical protein